MGLEKWGISELFLLKLFNSEDEASATNGVLSRNGGGASRRVRNGLEHPAGLRGGWRECPGAGGVFPKTMR